MKNTNTAHLTFIDSNQYIHTWGTPLRVDVVEMPDRIEFIYVETSTIVFNNNPPPPPERRVFKIVFSCVDGKWNKSDPIFGEIFPALNETYKFSEDESQEF